MKDRITLSLDSELIQKIRMLSLEEYGKSRYMGETVTKLLTEALENRSAEHVLIKGPDGKFIIEEQ